MSKLLLFFIVIVLLAACNSNQSNSVERVAKDSSSSMPIPTASNDSAPKTITAKFFIDTLTVAEMQDDSVFADGSQPSSWSNAGFDHPIEFKKFLKRLQYWVANNQKDSVASTIVFPLKHPPIKNKTAFLMKYDSLFNDNVKKALLSQNLRQIFRRDQGAMIGDGQLWFNETKKGFTIITINN
ncbi:MAG: hypothetical protein QM726_19175 [Chitinophagaceae bacterium]